MNDEQYEAQKARVQALIDAWVKPLGLSWWRWRTEWHREPIPDAEGAIFEILVRFDYHDVRLDVCAPKVADLTDENREWAFVHELCHVLTIPLKDGVARGLEGDGLSFLEEHQASAIADSLIWFRDHLTAPKE